MHAIRDCRVKQYLIRVTPAKAGVQSKNDINLFFISKFPDGHKLVSIRKWHLLAPGGVLAFLKSST